MMGYLVKASLMVARLPF